MLSFRKKQTKSQSQENLRTDNDGQKDKREDRWKVRQTHFIRPFRLRPGVQKDYASLKMKGQYLINWIQWLPYLTKNMFCISNFLGSFTHFKFCKYLF